MQFILQNKLYLKYYSDDLYVDYRYKHNIVPTVPTVHSSLYLNNIQL